MRRVTQIAKNLFPAVDRLGRTRTPKLGLALGGGFARGLAHIGVLRVFEDEGIPLHAIAGVSAGAMAAAAFASGASFTRLSGWRAA